MIPLKTLGRLLRPGLLVAMAVMMTGCDWALFDPKGHVAQEELTLLITCTVLMLLVVIPVIVMTLVFAWKYRASNTKARYEPTWHHSTAIEVVIWSIPCMIVLVLAVLTWRSSHALDPYKPLESDKKAISIEAISLDWKWLFIYPEENIAVVNELTFPVDAPLNFKLTSDTVMNAFFIPHLGSMIYSMAGMETKLHLIANEAGSFDGAGAHYSGAGFNKMYFKAHAVTEEQYQQWLAKVRAEGSVLDQASLDTLAAQKNHDWFPVTYYGSTQAGLFKDMLNKHAGESHHFGMKHEAGEHAAHDAAAAGHEGHEAVEAPAAADAAVAEPAEHNADEHAAAGHAGHGASGE